MGNYDKHFWGSREQRKKISGSREHELKTFLGTRGFINGEQGIKSKKIKGLWEHVPPPPPWEGLANVFENAFESLAQFLSFSGDPFKVSDRGRLREYPLRAMSKYRV